MRIIVLVGCGKRKLSVSARADELYSSPLSIASKRWALAVGDEWHILSAKHGLLAPERVIEPYDVSLGTFTASQRREWAAKIVDRLSRPETVQDAVVVILGGGGYISPLSTLLQDCGFNVICPLVGLSVGQRIRYLSEPPRDSVGWATLELFYMGLERLQAAGLGRSLETGLHWPERGVYFFFEPSEYRRNGRSLRVTRVGTHAVSRGSKATLWNRLKTHYGDGSGSGAHRSSIFRLHVGASLMALGLPAVASWGSQTRPTETVQVELEVLLEKAVSERIRAMRVVVLPILDDSKLDSDRAFVERNAIALLSGIGRHFDPPSADWLGLYSPRSDIRKSGLWNLNHVGGVVDRRFLRVYSELVRNAVKGSPVIRSIAPVGWHSSPQGVDGLGLFD